MRYSALFALPLFAVTALAQTTVFSNAAPRATSSVIAGSNVGAPSLRYWGASASDGTSLFYFGGREVTATGGAGPTYFNGLNAYNPTTNTWTNLSADGAIGAPQNRWRPAIAYDPIADRIVVFGGLDSPAGPTVFADCFAFDLGTNTWSTLPNPIPGTTGPSARFDSKMAFDASTGSLMLFGGQGTGGGSTRTNDTWLLLGTQWLEMTPTTRPSERSIFAMTARSAPYNDIILLGGRSGGATLHQILQDTWRWDGATANWEMITPIDSTRPVTWGGGNDAIYDSVRQVVTVLNGYGTGTAPSTATAAGSWTSEYDCVKNEWRAYGNDTSNQLANDPVIDRQQRFAVAFLNGKTYFWGGRNPPASGTGNLPFVKHYQATPLATTMSYGAGCNGSTGNPLTLTADNAPWTCRTWNGTCSNLGTTTLALPVFGLNTASVPLPAILPIIGQAGCMLLNSADLITGPLIPLAGSSTFSIELPNNAALAGQLLHAQVAEVNLTLTGIWTSNGLTATIGAL